MSTLRRPLTALARPAQQVHDTLPAALAEAAARLGVVTGSGGG